ncbi:MAG: ATP-binding protein [Acidobacteriaceae bacterium]
MSMMVAGPATIATVLLVAQMPWSKETKSTCIIALLLTVLLAEAAMHDEVIRPLQTLTNVVSSLRENDYSFRARGADPNDALGELAQEINALANTLAEQKVFAVEATELLRRVVEEIDVPLFTFDPANKLRLVNGPGARLLQRPPEALLGNTAEEIGLVPYLLLQQGSTTSSPLNPNARWLVRKTSFRQNGVPHTLIMLSDVSRALRDEERSAWQRLIRVLGHELNNSLTPIKSIAGTLRERVVTSGLSSSEAPDFERGLNIIESRAASLNRFLQGYRQLAQMPKPALRKVALRELVERAAALELRVKVSVHNGPESNVMIDTDQFEQMLINVIRNAADAALESATAAGAQSDPRVEVRWYRTSLHTVLEIADTGPGLLNPDNAFVPFYTTKSGGTGIGLVLSRQIVEAHGGSIELLTGEPPIGCIARVYLPLT